VAVSQQRQPNFTLFLQHWLHQRVRDVGYTQFHDSQLQRLIYELAMRASQQCRLANVTVNITAVVKNNNSDRSNLFSAKRSRLWNVVT